MSQEIEIEFKNLLTKTEFETIMKELNLAQHDFKSQENYYFDTNTFSLKSHGAALRIRKKTSSYTLTLKQPHEQGLLETHQLLTAEQAISLLEGTSLAQLGGKVVACIQTLGINPLDITYLGTLRTERAEITDGENILVLDHSFYLNHEDYELEYEVKNPVKGKQQFLEILEQYKIPVRTTDNKISRFFQIKSSKEDRS